MLFDEWLVDVPKLLDLINIYTTKNSYNTYINSDYEPLNV